MVEPIFATSPSTACPSGSRCCSRTSHRSSSRSGALPQARLAGGVQIWKGLALDGLGVAFALASAASFCVYILLAERGVLAAIRSLRHLPATRVGIEAMLEPVAAALVAWGWLGETLNAPQLAGGAIVPTAIGLAQTAR